MRMFWDEIEPDGFMAKHYSVALLRKRLKELARAHRLTYYFTDSCIKNAMIRVKKKAEWIA
jgi:hypothetical protein